MENKGSYNFKKPIDKTPAKYDLIDTSKERQEKILGEMDNDKSVSNYLIGVAVISLSVLGTIMICYWLFEMWMK